MSLKKQILENLSRTASLLASQPALTYAGEDLKLSGCWMVAMGLQRGKREIPRQDADGRAGCGAWPDLVLRVPNWKSTPEDLV